MKRLSHTGLLLLLGVLVCFAFLASLLTGDVTAGRLWQGLLQSSTTLQVVLFELRLPRALLGLLVGFSLGMAGAALQGFLRNPLAEPGIVGVSGSAALGAVLVFYTGLSGVFDLALPLGGFIGACLGVGVLYLIAGRRANTVTLILAGIAVNAVATAGMSLALNLSPNPYASFEIIFWQLGSLADRSMQHVTFALPFMLVGWLLLLSVRGSLDVFTLGEDTAASMGVRTQRVGLLIILGTALCVGAAVSVSGIIGFVGLIVPHLLRPVVGHQPSRLLLSSGLAGALLLLVADIAVRLVPSNVELKLGVLTALLGAPFFLYLVRRHHVFRSTL